MGPRALQAAPVLDRAWRLALPPRIACQSPRGAAGKTSVSTIPPPRVTGSAGVWLFLGPQVQCRLAEAQRFGPLAAAANTTSRRQVLPQEWQPCAASKPARGNIRKPPEVPPSTRRPSAKRPAQQSHLLQALLNFARPICPWRKSRARCGEPQIIWCQAAWKRVLG